MNAIAWHQITAHLVPADRAMVLRMAGVEDEMPEGLTRKPLTVREWLENVRSRGGDDAEWAHLLLMMDRSGRFTRCLGETL